MATAQRLDQRALPALLCHSHVVLRQLLWDGLTRIHPPLSGAGVVASRQEDRALRLPLTLMTNGPIPSSGETVVSAPAACATKEKWRRSFRTGFSMQCQENAANAVISTSATVNWTVSDIRQPHFHHLLHRKAIQIDAVG